MAMTTAAGRSTLFLAAVISLGGCRAKEAPPQGRAAVDARPRLGDVPVGSWSEYAIMAPEQPALYRVALVSRVDGRSALENTIESTGGAPAAKVTTRDVFAPGQSIDDVPAVSAVQVGSFPPMEQPSANRRPSMGSGPAAGEPTRTGDERVTTPAGTFAATRFHQKSPDGVVVDFWLSREVFPLGLVKLRETSPERGESITELRRAGSGASPTITAATVPYDEDLLLKQMMASLKDSQRK